MYYHFVGCFEAFPLAATIQTVDIGQLLAVHGKMTKVHAPVGLLLVIILSHVDPYLLISTCAFYLCSGNLPGYTAARRNQSG